MIKRFLDIIIAGFLLVLLSPLFLVVSILIKLDGGPVFYRQARVGRLGRNFDIIKFRSMVINADKLGGYSTKEGDSRITKVGKFIRKSSIDELPQLINVLFNDMSLVGPRPNVPVQRCEYSEEDWRLRNSVKPGITGLAQATLRSEATPEERTALDLEYVKSQNLANDFRIILQTIWQVARKGGV